MGRFVMAVVAGFVLWTVLWFAAGMVVKTVNPEALGEDGATAVSNGIFVLFVMVAALACIVSGWLAALLGRDKGQRAAMVLAVLLLVVGLGVQIANWGTVPVWFHLVFLGLLVPATMGGAALKRV